MDGIADTALANFTSVFVWKVGISLYIRKVFGFYIIYNPFTKKIEN